MRAAEPFVRHDYINITLNEKHFAMKETNTCFIRTYRCVNRLVQYDNALQLV